MTSGSSRAAVSTTSGSTPWPGKRREEYGLDPTRYGDMLPGLLRPQERVKDMDLDGVHAQLCFPELSWLCRQHLLQRDGQRAG